MINDKHDLVATFTNGLGKEQNWTYKGVNPDLPIPVIKEACELLTNLDIFEQNGVKLFDSIVTAKIVTTKETEIFDVKNDPKIEEKEPLDEVKTANERVHVDPKIGPYLLTKNAPQIGELSIEKCKKNSAGFPSVSLPASQVSKIPDRLPKTDVSDLKATHSKTNSPTTDKIPKPPTQSSEKNEASLRHRFARLWGKKGKNKEDPS